MRLKQIALTSLIRTFFSIFIIPLTKQSIYRYAFYIWCVVTTTNNNKLLFVLLSPTNYDTY
jgi:hypothetical protein